MGIRQRVVTETVAICDLCKGEIESPGARLGSLTLRTPGQRGRAPSYDLAFHTDCAAKIIDTANKSGGAPKKRASTGAKTDGATTAPTIKKTRRGRPKKQTTAPVRAAKRSRAPRGSGRRAPKK